MNPEPDPTLAAAAGTTCSNCGLEEKKLLHHVRLSKNCRRLCTTCVLRLLPLTFCPTCFDVYHPSLPPYGPRDAVTCSNSKCRSSSHSQCVGPSVTQPYICPLCVDPNSPVFKLKKVKDLSSEELKALNGKEVDGEYRVFDQRAAKVLFAAAKIASASMSKAVATARIEAERRAREAAISRKRARETLEHVNYLVAKEKLEKKKTAALGTPSAELLGNLGNARAGVNLIGVTERKFNPNVCGSNINGPNVSGNNIKSPNVSGNNIKSPNVSGTTNISGKAGNLDSGITRMGMVGEDRLRLVGIPARMDSSNEVLAALNAVELREGEKVPELKVENSMVEPPLNDVVPMDIDEGGVVEVNPGLIDGEDVIDDHVGLNEIEKKIDLNHLHSHGEEVENVSNGQVLVSSIEDQGKHSESIQQLNNNGSEQ